MLFFRRYSLLGGRRSKPFFFVPNRVSFARVASPPAGKIMASGREAQCDVLSQVFPTLGVVFNRQEDLTSLPPI